MQTIAEIGCDRPVTIGPEENLDTALQRLLESDATEIYVTDDDGHLLGIVPDFELLKARLSGAWTDTTIGQLSSQRVLCFTPETACSTVLKAFREGQHSRAAILQDDRLVGQITRTAILQWLSDSIEETPAPVASPRFLQAPRVLSGMA